MRGEEARLQSHHDALRHHDLRQISEMITTEMADGPARAKARQRIEKREFHRTKRDLRLVRKALKRHS